MQTTEFRRWLEENGYGHGTVASRVANCTRIEKFCGDLDELHIGGNLDSLIDDFEYSTDDERNRRPKRHKVPIKGNVHNGSATLKAALVLYKDFLASVPRGKRVKNGVSPPLPPSSSDWPRWDEPSEAEALQFARVLAPYVRFLRPDIVEALVDDNERMRQTWCDRLRAWKIDPEVYLWERSPCAFPGVRRYAGSEEIAIYRGHKPANAGTSPGAIVLDDNDFPKHLWSFVLRGKPFQKHGPEGYSLAHLADHKDHQNRATVDFEFANSVGVGGKLFGLYTCPTNTVYVPRSFLKPTDFNGTIRNLLIRRAQDLYGPCCSIVPPLMQVRANMAPDWDISEFQWSAPVGDITHVSAFLRFRADKLDQLMRDSRLSKENPTSDICAT